MTYKEGDIVFGIPILATRSGLLYVNTSDIEDRKIRNEFRDWLDKKPLGNQFWITKYPFFYNSQKLHKYGTHAYLWIQFMEERI